MSDVEKIRSLCIENVWFTGGFSKSYSNMLDMVKDRERFSNRDIAVAIWVCSCDVDFETVLEAVERCLNDGEVS